MILTEFAISRPLLVRIAFFLIIVLGAYSYISIPRFLDPDIKVGEAFIYTISPGFSPEEMERLVTNKIEEELDGISEIRRHESISYESTSKIHIYFNTELSEYEIDKAMQEVRNAVDRVDDLPKETKVPRVIEIDVAVFPVVMVALAGSLDAIELQERARDIADAIESIEGVSEVDILGKREREIWIELDPGRMSAYGISVPEVAKAISGRVRNLPGGSMTMGGHEIAIRMKGEPKVAPLLGDIAIRSGDHGSVFLRDVADIVQTLEKPNTLTAVDKENALVLSVKRKRKTNVIRIVDEVKLLVAGVPQSYPGLEPTLYFDQSSEIRKRIKELQNNALMGMGAVFAVLWLTMGARNAVLACLGIPVSFLLTFIFMKFAGFSIDGLTLFALILVLGILVDDAIVVLENIQRHIETGTPVLKAAVEGSGEVLGPVIASVTTTMAAFLPILVTVGGVIGRYMSPLPKVVIFALGASLIEVFLMMPSHLVEFTPAGSKENRQDRADIFTFIRRLYYPFLRKILKHKLVAVGVILFSTFLAFLLYFKTDFVMFPKSDIFPRFNIYFDLPVNTGLEQTRDVLMDLSDIVKKRISSELEATVAVAGMKEINYEPILGYHFGMLSVLLKTGKDRRRGVAEVMEEVREDVGRLLREKGATSWVLDRMLEGPPVGPDVDLKIQASSWERSASISRHIREGLAGASGITDIRDDFSRDKQFVEITVDEEKAKRLGIDQELLTACIQAGFYGLPVAKYNQGKDEQDIKLKYPLQYRGNFDDLMNMKLGIAGAGEVLLKDIAEIRISPGFQSIYHYNGKQTVRLTASVSTEAGTNESGFLANVTGKRMTPVRANALAQEIFAKMKGNYPEARLVAGGVQEDTNRSLRELGYAGALALFLIFLILAIEFNSVLQPVIIMITIPFVSLGVILGLLVGNNPITFVTLIGMLTLSGIVVNDSLVLIEFINRYQKEHPGEVYKAIVRACHVRLRPIILTSVTTIFGVAPMALGLGGKSPFWAPLATAIMWGLAFSTILVLCMVPAYYAMLEDMRYFFKNRRKKTGISSDIGEAFLLPEVMPYLRRRNV